VNEWKLVGARATLPIVGQSATCPLRPTAIVAYSTQLSSTQLNSTQFQSISFHSIPSHSIHAAPIVAARAGEIIGPLAVSRSRAAALLLAALFRPAGGRAEAGLRAPIGALKLKTGTWGPPSGEWPTSELPPPPAKVGVPPASPALEARSAKPDGNIKTNSNAERLKQGVRPPLHVGAGSVFVCRVCVRCMLFARHVRIIVIIIHKVAQVGECKPSASVYSASGACKCGPRTFTRRLGAPAVAPLIGGRGRSYRVFVSLACGRFSLNLIQTINLGPSGRLCWVGELGQLAGERCAPLSRPIHAPVPLIALAIVRRRRRRRHSQQPAASSQCQSEKSKWANVAVYVYVSKRVTQFDLICLLRLRLCSLESGLWSRPGGGGANNGNRNRNRNSSRATCAEPPGCERAASAQMKDEQAAASPSARLCRQPWPAHLAGISRRK